MIKLYKRLNAGWKRLLWVLGIIFSLVVPGIINPNMYLDVISNNSNLSRWTIEETIIVIYLTLAAWWVAVFYILIIIEGFRKKLIRSFDQRITVSLSSFCLSFLKY